MSEDLDIRAQCAAAELQTLAKRFLAVHGLTQNSIVRLNEMVADETRRFRQDGIDFPPLAILALPRQQAVKFYRRDLDERGIKNVLKELTGEYPDITAEELFRAMMLAYPEYVRRLMN